MFVMKDRSGNFLHIVHPMSVPLQVADSSAGEVVYEMCRRVQDIPGLQAMRAQFPLNIDMASTDSASSNKRGETAFFTDNKLAHLFLHLFCDVHWIHTIQGRAYGVVSNIVAGCVSFSLAQRPGGSTEKLRRAIRLSLLARVQKVDAPP